MIPRTGNWKPNNNSRVADIALLEVPRGYLKGLKLLASRCRSIRKRPGMTAFLKISGSALHTVVSCNQMDRAIPFLKLHVCKSYIKYNQSRKHQPTIGSVIPYQNDCLQIPASSLSRVTGIDDLDFRNTLYEGNNAQTTSQEQCKDQCGNTQPAHANACRKDELSVCTQLRLFFLGASAQEAYNDGERVTPCMRTQHLEPVDLCQNPYALLFTSTTLGMGLNFLVAMSSNYKLLKILGPFPSLSPGREKKK